MTLPALLCGRAGNKASDQNTGLSENETLPLNDVCGFIFHYRKTERLTPAPPIRSKKQWARRNSCCVCITSDKHPTGRPSLCCAPHQQQKMAKRLLNCPVIAFCSSVLFHKWGVSVQWHTALPDSCGHSSGSDRLFLSPSFLFSCLLRPKLTGRVNARWANALKGLSICVSVPLKLWSLCFLVFLFLCLCVGWWGFYLTFHN